MSFLFLRNKTVWIGFSKSTGLKSKSLGIKMQTTSVRNGKPIYPREAKDIQLKIDKEIAIGKFGLHQDKPIPLLSVLLKNFLSYKGNTIGKAQQFEYTDSVKKLKISLGDLPIANYNNYALGVFRSTLLETYSWNTVSRIMRNLHGVFNFASNEYKIDNPIKNLRLKQDIKNVRIFSLQELERFLVKGYEYSPDFFNQCLFLLLTGMRVTESCKLTFDKLNFDMKYIGSRNLKGNRDETFPMDLALEEFLRTVPKTNAPLVFKYPNRRRLENAFIEVAKISELPAELKIHNLKKTFSTLLAETNAPMHITQELSHHSSITTTLRYYIFKRLEAKRSALDEARKPIMHLIKRTAQIK